MCLPRKHQEEIEKDKNTKTSSVCRSRQGYRARTSSNSNLATDEEGNKAATEEELVLPEGPTWKNPFFNYLIHNILPQDVTEARRISRRSKAFTIINR